MSTNFELEGGIRRVIAGVFEIPEEGIQDDVDFYQAYNVDSLRMIEVIVELEKTFALRIPPPDLDLENIKTFGQLLALIRQHIPETQAVN
jgi:acyl carrier protein